MDPAISAASVHLSELSVDLATKQNSIQSYMNEQNRLADKRKYYANAYFLLIALIALFVLFVAAWMAQILARQISIPISALLGAAKEVRQGNLAYRVRVRAMDELATLVRAFNEMTGELEVELQGTRGAAPVHGSDSGKHSDRRHFGFRGWPYRACESRSQRHLFE